jgi:hypothetical protein
VALAAVGAARAGVERPMCVRVASRSPTASSPPAAEAVAAGEAAGALAAAVSVAPERLWPAAVMAVAVEAAA